MVSSHDLIHRWLLVTVTSLAGCARRPAPAAANSPDAMFTAPADTAMPAGPLGVSIRRGEAIFAATGDSLPDHDGSSLRCASCHLDNGRSARGLPLRGVYARFPQYRSRVNAVQRIEDRINDCFARSLNRRPLAFDDPAMRDLVAYLAFLSRGDPVGPPPVTPPHAVSRGDTAAGRTVYANACARCHGAGGGGQGAYPPLWGAHSFTIGAGMARRGTMTTFVAANMPFDQPGTLSAIDAANVAAYVTSQSRPDFAGKERDWPLGDAPADTPYRTNAGRAGATPPAASP